MIGASTTVMDAFNPETQKITIISAVYPPEPVVSARMSHDLANYLTAQGCQVTVLCPQPSRGGLYKGQSK